ncbi:MAG: hypothetical protein JNG85_05530, partial [Spirochaetaceae bacterium]|nr:hypothetical protein [Spirochaetaceae bacterium]
MKRLVTLLLALALGSALFAQAPATPRLKLATTTSTEQSGLLAYMLPVFEKKT